jgi:prephenate dehydrogenase
MTSPSEGAGRAQVVGTGLIGGSVGMALRARGWHVAGTDADPARARRALELGALDEVGEDPEADVTFVATPASSVAKLARHALDKGLPRSVVTDVAGVKGPVVSAVSDPRFVGGHPMAGSEQEGVEGASPEMFAGATWVLTPTASTDPEAFARVRALVVSLGAEVVAIPPERHDALVAMVSHVPHLTAATLMRLAAEDALQHQSLLRLAAGGFRDMTRIAAGDSAIWPDICAENAEAILVVLDRLVDALSTMRQAVARRDRPALLLALEEARRARRNLPGRAVQPEELAELRIPVADRPGTLAFVTTRAGELGVNIADLEIAHSAEGERGVLILVVDAQMAPVLQKALAESGLRVAVGPLS